MPTYFFHLGNTPELSLLELEHLVEHKLKLILPQIAKLSTEKELDLIKVQKQSGGLVKSFVQLTELQTDSTSEVESKIIDFLLSKSGKVTFSVSGLGDQNLSKINYSNIKNELKKNKIRSRYIESGKQGLSAAVLLHQDVEEFVIINNEEKLVLAKTITVQNIDNWTKKDRRKPYFDRKKGMLPPKVARMMINIALGFHTGKSNNLTLYDPFSGSGTVLMEAMLLGLQIKGADLDKNSVEGTKNNLNWLIDQYHLDSKFSIILRDATQKFDNSETPFVDLMITEPFLGKPTPKEKELPNIFKGLYRTYLGTLKNWTQILKTDSIIVIILPLVETKHKEYNLQKLIDKLPQLGYTTVSQPVIYSRPQAIVKRQIIFLKFKG